MPVAGQKEGLFILSIPAVMASGQASEGRWSFDKESHRVGGSGNSCDGLVLEASGLRDQPHAGAHGKQGLKGVGRCQSWQTGLLNRGISDT